LVQKFGKRLKGSTFKALRLALKDYCQRLGKNVVDKMTNRLSPKKYAKNISCSLAMKVHYNKKQMNLNNTIFANTYFKSRSPGRMFGYDTSVSRRGRQATRNWIGQNLGQIKEQWTLNHRSNDSIRVLLKKTFYPNQ